MFSSLLEKAHQTAYHVAGNIANKLSSHEQHSHTHHGSSCTDGAHDSPHRYGSFASQRNGNDVKWYVDGCSYMWAVSRALEGARESVWILDCLY